MDIKRIDIFNRGDLIGDQSISTINNFNDYLDSLLNPFNNQLTEFLIELDLVEIDTLNTYDTSIINELQIEDNNIINSLTLINDSSNITNKCNTYIADLTTNKNILTTIFNTKALSTTPLIRPTLVSVINSNTSAVNKLFVNNEVLKYSLPMPIPNTRLYVNKEGTNLIWA